MKGQIQFSLEMVRPDSYWSERLMSSDPVAGIWGAGEHTKQGLRITFFCSQGRQKKGLFSPGPELQGRREVRLPDFQTPRLQGGLMGVSCLLQFHGWYVS